MCFTVTQIKQSTWKNLVKSRKSVPEPPPGLLGVGWRDERSATWVRSPIQPLFWQGVSLDFCRTHPDSTRMFAKASSPFRMCIAREKSQGVDPPGCCAIWSVLEHAQVEACVYCAPPQSSQKTQWKWKRWKCSESGCGESFGAPYFPRVYQRVFFPVLGWIMRVENMEEHSSGLVCPCDGRHDGYKQCRSLQAFEVPCGDVFGRKNFWPWQKVCRQKDWWRSKCVERKDRKS